MTLAAWVVVYQVPEPHAQFLILLASNYANFVSHWGAWQATRAEGEAGKSGGKA